MSRSARARLAGDRTLALYELLRPSQITSIYLWYHQLSPSTTFDFNSAVFDEKTHSALASIGCTDRSALYADGVQHFSLFFVPWHRTKSHIVVQLKLKRAHGRWFITQQTGASTPS